jgi:diadenosine tetraphosphatase ApaH/serine/threonine PP2A family protein phosphatase
MIEHIQILRGLPTATAKVDAAAVLSLYSGPFGFAAFFDTVQKRMLNGTGLLLRTQQDLAEVVKNTTAQMSVRPVASQTALVAQPSKLGNSSSFGQAGQPFSLLPRQAAEVSSAPAPSAAAVVGSYSPQRAGVSNSIAPPVRISAASPAPAPQLPSGIVAVSPAGQSVPQSIPRGMPAPPSMLSGWTVSDAHSSQGVGASALALRIVRRLMELSNGPRSDWRYTLQLASSREMLLLCDTVVEILRAEDSLVQVSLPCRVYGDIHGQLLDLLEFFNAFSWPDKRRGDIFSMNYVFLGDFVDRGNFSCDVICLLFSLKILYPTKVFLVRGNHEDRLMNINYGFQADCIRKFAADGEDLWERCNDVFEFLPIAALVEGAILCIHGGIGDSISLLDDLRGIPKPIQVPGDINEHTTRRDRVILDALWSDPTDNDSVLGVHCSPRGKNTCRFGPDRVQDFNLRNGLKLLIRAHECVQHGYEYFAHGQLLTVFSATNYCNQYNNDGAMVVLVKDDHGEIVEHAQVIKSGTVDTSHGWNEQQFRAPSPMRRTEAGTNEWA